MCIVSLSLSGILATQKRRSRSSSISGLISLGCIRARSDPRQPSGLTSTMMLSRYGSTASARLRSSHADALVTGSICDAPC